MEEVQMSSAIRFYNNTDVWSENYGEKKGLSLS